VIGQKTADLAATVRHVILKKAFLAVKFRARLYGVPATKGPRGFSRDGAFINTAFFVDFPLGSLRH